MNLDEKQYLMKRFNRPIGTGYGRTKWGSRWLRNHRRRARGISRAFGHNKSFRTQGRFPSVW